MSVVALTKDLIPTDDPNWGNSMNSYNQSKKILQWGSNPMPHYISEKMVKENNNLFNPVTQVYTNNDKNRIIKEKEKKTLIHSLSQYYDNSLKYKQTFDIINLKDHFKGFEDHSDYPQFKSEKIKNNKERSKVCYNILSNINLNEHSPYSPECRPKIEPNDFNNNGMSKPIILNKLQYKDYNIISNRYKEFHDDKSNVEHQINQLTAFKKLKESSDYDFINGRYYNEDLQEKHDAHENRQKKILMQLRSYNPVNNVVIDSERVKAYDLHEANKKLRFKTKKQVEDYYRNKALENDLKEENSRKAHLDYLPYKYLDKRGYNFMTNEKNSEYYKHQCTLKNNRTDWELLKDNASENETFTRKGIYKPQYNKNDQEEDLFNYNKKRRDLMQSLPQMQDDHNFKRNITQNKKSELKKNEMEKNALNKLTMSSVVGNVFINKKDWFENNKNVIAELQTGSYRFKKT